MIKFHLMNGKEVEVSQEEIAEFISEVLMPNPFWSHSQLLGKEEAMAYLKGESTQEGLRKVARYILIFFENLSFSGYLFDKAEGEHLTEEFNKPVINKLREIYLRVTKEQRTIEELAGDVHEMENLCTEMGAGPM